MPTVESTVNKLGEELVKTKIRKEFLMKNGRFPIKYEMEQLKKRVYNLVKKRYGSLYEMRKDRMEKKIQNLINEVFEQFKF